MLDNIAETAKRVAIVTNNLICEMNTKYYSMLERYFKANGWTIVGDFNADMVVFATCGFSDDMYGIIKNAIIELKDLGFSEDRVVILGCVVKTHPENLREVFNGHSFEFGREDLLDAVINAKVPFSSIKITNVFKCPGSEVKSHKGELFNIQIGDGCLKQCTFCVIHKSHGDIRTMPLEDITAQFRHAIDNGYRNINLVGVDTFSYGYDTGTNILELIDHLMSIEPDVKFYMGSLHIRWLKQFADGILSLCKRGVINSLHIGLQHVNNEVLKRMGRHADFPELYSILCNFKAQCPDLFLSTDLIVGFPGETNQMFMEMVDFLKNDKCFQLINHYMYSDVKGAPSYNFSGKVDDNTKLMRWNILKKVIGNRAPNVVLSSRDSVQYSRYNEVYKKQNNKQYHFCMSTYEDI